MKKEPKETAEEFLKRLLNSEEGDRNRREIVRRFNDIWRGYKKEDRK